MSSAMSSPCYTSVVSTLSLILLFEDALLSRLLLYLASGDLLRVSELSRHFHIFLSSRDKGFWKQVFERDFSSKLHDSEAYMRTIKSQNWKWMYYKQLDSEKRLRSFTPFVKVLPKVLEQGPDTQQFKGVFTVSPDGEHLVWYNGSLMQCIRLQDSCTVWCWIKGCNGDSSIRFMSSSHKTENILPAISNVSSSKFNRYANHDARNYNDLIPVKASSGGLYNEEFLSQKYGEMQVSFQDEGNIFDDEFSVFDFKEAIPKLHDAGNITNEFSSILLEENPSCSSPDPSQGYMKRQCMCTEILPSLLEGDFHGRPPEIKEGYFHEKLPEIKGINFHDLSASSPSNATIFSKKLKAPNLFDNIQDEANSPPLHHTDKYFEDLLASQHSNTAFLPKIQKGDLVKSRSRCGMTFLECVKQISSLIVSSPLTDVEKCLNEDKNVLKKPYTTLPTGDTIAGCLRESIERSVLHRTMGAHLDFPFIDLSPTSELLAEAISWPQLSLKSLCVFLLCTIRVLERHIEDHQVGKQAKNAASLCSSLQSSRNECRSCGKPSLLAYLNLISASAFEGAVNKIFYNSEGLCAPELRNGLRNDVCFVDKIGSYSASLASCDRSSIFMKHRTLCCAYEAMQIHFSLADTFFKLLLPLVFQKSQFLMDCPKKGSSAISPAVALSNTTSSATLNRKNSGPSVRTQPMNCADRAGLFSFKDLQEHACKPIAFLAASSSCSIASTCSNKEKNNLVDLQQLRGSQSHIPYLIFNYGFLKLLTKFVNMLLCACANDTQIAASSGPELQRLNLNEKTHSTGSVASGVNDGAGIALHNLYCLHPNTSSNNLDFDHPTLGSSHKRSEKGDMSLKKPLLNTLAVCNLMYSSLLKPMIKSLLHPSLDASIACSKDSIFLYSDLKIFRFSIKTGRLMRCVLLANICEEGIFEGKNGCCLKISEQDSILFLIGLTRLYIFEEKSLIYKYKLGLCPEELGIHRYAEAQSTLINDLTNFPGSSAGIDVVNGGRHDGINGARGLLDYNSSSLLSGRSIGTTPHLWKRLEFVFGGFVCVNSDKLDSKESAICCDNGISTESAVFHRSRHILTFMPNHRSNICVWDLSNGQLYEMLSIRKEAFFSSGDHTVSPNHPPNIIEVCIIEEPHRADYLIAALHSDGTILFWNVCERDCRNHNDYPVYDTSHSNFSTSFRRITLRYVMKSGLTHPVSMALHDGWMILLAKMEKRGIALTYELRFLAEFRRGDWKKGRWGTAVNKISNNEIFVRERSNLCYAKRSLCTSKRKDQVIECRFTDESTHGATRELHKGSFTKATQNFIVSGKKKPPEDDEGAGTRCNMRETASPFTTKGNGYGCGEQHTLFSSNHGLYDDAHEYRAYLHQTDTCAKDCAICLKEDDNNEHSCPFCLVDSVEKLLDSRIRCTKATNPSPFIARNGIYPVIIAVGDSCAIKKEQASSPGIVDKLDRRIAFTAMKNAGESTCITRASTEPYFKRATRVSTRLLEKKNKSFTDISCSAAANSLVHHSHSKEKLGQIAKSLLSTDDRAMLKTSNLNVIHEVNSFPGSVIEFAGVKPDFPFLMDKADVQNLAAENAPFDRYLYPTNDIEKVKNEEYNSQDAAGSLCHYTSCLEPCSGLLNTCNNPSLTLRKDIKQEVSQSNNLSAFFGHIPQSDNLMNDSSKALSLQKQDACCDVASAVDASEDENFTAITNAFKAQQTHGGIMDESFFRMSAFSDCMLYPSLSIPIQGSKIEDNLQITLLREKTSTSRNSDKSEGQVSDNALVECTQDTFSSIIDELPSPRETSFKRSPDCDSLKKSFVFPCKTNDCLSADFNTLPPCQAFLSQPVPTSGDCGALKTEDLLVIPQFDYLRSSSSSTLDVPDFGTRKNWQQFGSFAGQGKEMKVPNHCHLTDSKTLRNSFSSLMNAKNFSTASRDHSELTDHTKASSSSMFRNLAVYQITISNEEFNLFDCLETPAFGFFASGQRWKMFEDVRFKGKFLGGSQYEDNLTRHSNWRFLQFPRRMNNSRSLESGDCGLLRLSMNLGEVSGKSGYYNNEDNCSANSYLRKEYNYARSCLNNSLNIPENLFTLPFVATSSKQSLMVSTVRFSDRVDTNFPPAIRASPDAENMPSNHNQARGAHEAPVTTAGEAALRQREVYDFSGVLNMIALCLDLRQCVNLVYTLVKKDGTVVVYDFSPFRTLEK